MCGIYGIWHLDGRHVDLARLQAATDRIAHRGPDDEGYLLAATRAGTTAPCAGPATDTRIGLRRVEEYESFGADLALGFRRLAILDLSPAGHQPMASADQATWIVFNGEIYNYLELRERLVQHGHTFRTGGDTEVILAAYETWGADCLQHLNGMWAFAIWSIHTRRLFLARDRFGIKPLYYTFDGHTFAFASEPKALLGAVGIPFVPEEGAIYRFLTGGLLPSSREGATFFKGIHALPPGHSMTLDEGAPATRRYWRLVPDERVAFGAEEAIEAYAALFQDALRLQLRSDVAVGTCLSGGVDSSSIVCLVNKLMQLDGLSAAQIGDRQKTFSAVYRSEGPYNERAYIERVIGATGVESTFTFPNSERLMRDLEALIWHQDEPFLSTSIFAQWCVMDAVHERGVTVLLDGQGADESLAGYRPFEIYLGEVVRSGHPTRALVETLEIGARTGLAPLPLAARALALQLPLPLLQALQRRFGARPLDTQPLNPDFVARHGGATPNDWWDWNEHRTLQGHLLHQIEEASLPHLLRYEDRNSMAFGVEARVPFLDHRLVELSFGGVAPWRIHKGWTKWVLRQSMDRLVPDAVTWRASKIGFETPQDEWLTQWAHANPDCFHDTAASGAYLNLPLVRHSLAEGETTTKDPGRLWRWINLELWLKRWSTT